MSLRALLYGAAGHLRDHQNRGTGYTVEECRVMPDGQPPACAGDFFVAVHPERWGVNQGRNRSDTLWEEYTLAVTVSMRAGKVPYEDWGEKLMLPKEKGLLARCEAIRAALHINYNVTTTLAKDMVDNQGSLDGFESEPLFFASASNPQRQRASWWWGKDESEGFPYQGLSLTMQFGPTIRVQDAATAA